MKKLAIYGGKPVRENPFPRWPYFSPDEIQNVVSILESGRVNYWTGEVKELDGEKVRGFCGEFEKKISDYLGVNYAICLGNGTLALSLCLHALSIGEGDQVIVPSRTFIATASACVAQGAIPVFADVDLESQNLTLKAIEKVVTEKTKAIICVHLAGRSCEMDEIMDYAKKRGIKVIEDCAQSLGGKYRGQMLGTFGDMAAFSFCQDKILTTGGEGGMIVTNSPELYIKAWEYKDHGKNFHFFNTAVEHPLLEKEKAVKGGLYSSVGVNFRMTEMQAAIGLRQLEKLPSWIQKRRENAGRLISSLRSIPGLKIPDIPDHIFHVYYRLYAFLEEDRLKPDWTREKIVEAINKEGVPCELGSTWAIGSEKGWEKTYIIGQGVYDLRVKEHFPNDLKIGRSAIAFRVFPTIDSKSLDDVFLSAKKVLSCAIRSEK